MMVELNGNDGCVVGERNMGKGNTISYLREAG